MGFTLEYGNSGYRRARRQDYLLQAAGHRVFRVLATDVPARLPSFLDDILRLVAPTT